MIINAAISRNQIWVRLQVKEEKSEMEKNLAEIV